jgi:hypothetical protein
MACDVVTSGVYNITPHLVGSWEHIASAVGTLLNTKTGAWMNNSRDARVSKMSFSFRTI